MRIERSTPIRQTARTAQLEGMFDVPPRDRDTREFDVELDLGRPWNIGLIVGPSGTGKTTALTEVFGPPTKFKWPKGSAVVDCFDTASSITDITDALSAVGFSSPPAWLRPFETLSNGEQFRATVARALLDGPQPTIIDEFSSVVDRQVAQVASNAIAKWVRRTDKQLVAASCHYDIVDWLQPDWTWDAATGQQTWRHLQRRPPVNVVVYPAVREAWRVFRGHHYLTADIINAAQCWVAEINGQPAAFVSTINFPHPRIRHAKREHRTVVLPDYQGIGLGNAVSELIASAWTARGHNYYSTTSHPAMIGHRARSPLWRMTRKPSFGVQSGATSTRKKLRPATMRVTASFQYVGPHATKTQTKALIP